MWFFWLIIGLTLALVVAWFLFGHRMVGSITQAGAGPVSDVKRASEDLAAKRRAIAPTMPETGNEPAKLKSQSGGDESERGKVTDARVEGQSEKTAAAESKSIGEARHSNAQASISPDDLTRIKGIGPVLKGKLNGLGISTFQQVADMTSIEIARVDALLNFPGRIERDRWIEQAKAIVAGASSPA